MIDFDARVRAYIAGLAGIIAIVGTRVYVGRFLPPGYQPGVDGAAILLNTRGGTQDFSSQVLSASYSARCYASTEAGARDVFEALHGALNDAKTKGILYARMEEGTFPTWMTEPGSDWPYMLSFWRFQMHNA